MTKGSMEALDRAYKEIDGLRAFGGGALIRRALAAVLQEKDTEDGIAPALRCPIEPLRGPESIEAEPLGFDEFAREIRSEQGRRTVALDPVEQLALHLIDFYTGRIFTLEYRDGGDDTGVFDAADQKAREFVRNNCPLITVNWAGAKDEQEVIDSLRAMAAGLEASPKSGIDLTPSGMNVLRAVRCRNERVETQPNAWRENGTVLVQPTRTVKQCKYKDHCCWNSAWTEYGNWVETVVWCDGSIWNSPPVTPPDFERYPWDHRLPLIPGLMAVDVSSDFGWRRLNGQSDFHGGIDLAAPEGTPVFPAVGGEIEYFGTTVDGDRYIVVRDSPNSNTFRTYVHIVPNATLARGDTVVPGVTQLGTVAGIGRIHLHYGINDVPSGRWQDRNDSNAVNPLP